MRGLIYRKGKSAMQSGLAKTDIWVLRLIPEEKIYTQYQPAMWNGTTSTIKQKTLEFPNKQSTVDYCKTHSISVTEITTHTKQIRPKSYTDTICG